MINIEYYRCRNGMRSLVVDVAAPLRIVAKLYKFSSYLQGRSRNRTRLFARNIIAPGREGERELSTRLDL